MGCRVHYEGVTKYVLPGTVVWRRCHVLHTLVQEVPYDEAGISLAEPGATHGYIFKVLLSGVGEFLPEPVVSRVSGPGIVTFLDQPPPRDWTHLVIRGRSNNGKALFAEWAGSLPMEEYLAFRREYYRRLWPLEVEDPAQVSRRRLYIARRHGVDLPPGQHRGFYCVAPQGYWELENPLQEEAEEDENSVIPMRGPDARARDCLLAPVAAP